MALWGRGSHRREHVRNRIAGDPARKAVQIGEGLPGVGRAKDLPGRSARSLQPVRLEKLQRMRRRRPRESRIAASTAARHRVAWIWEGLGAKEAPSRGAANPFRDQRDVSPIAPGSERSQLRLSLKPETPAPSALRPRRPPDHESGDRTRRGERVSVVPPASPSASRNASESPARRRCRR